VYLPLRTGVTAAPTTTASSVPAHPRSGTETLLVVEDEPAVRALIRTVLERQGYTVFEAANGHEALECWQVHQNQIALVLTDLVMPGGLSGQQLGRQLRQSRPGLKVVYLSGYNVEIAGRTPSLQTGEWFMGKPFTADQLLHLVRQALDS
jgi:CheY-like chemotaxis protein